MARKPNIRRALGVLMVAIAVGTFFHGRARADVSVGAWMQHGPDDINTTNVPGLLTLSGDDATATATMPFAVTIRGTSYSTIVISTNGWIEFGSNSCTAGCGTANSDPVNTTLPTSKHTNPFLAVYWADDQTLSAAGFSGTDIRYGVVGTAPDRTYVVDFQLDFDPTSEGSPGSLGPANDDIRAQVEIHESSQVINVHYDSVGYQTCGLRATIGFQTAGGAGATAFPLVSNGRILDHTSTQSKSQGWSMDLHKSGAEALSALMSQSGSDVGQDPLEPFTTFSGDEAIAGVSLPFAVTIEGVSYNTATIGTNGMIQFGTTTGANPPIPAALPSASFSGPTLFWYWDDLDATSLRYGTVGTAPNRTFIIDFVEYLAVSQLNYLDGQVQIHEGSNLLSVRYRGLTTANSGQNGTIGFQGAGGATAAVYPLTFKGKILDDDRDDSQGWSVHAQATKDVSLHAFSACSPNDIGTAQTGVFTTLTGNDAIAGVTLPFSVIIDGTSYSTATIATNGLVQFGTTTGANLTTPTALPGVSFSGPTLFWYWDDLQTADTNIRYGTVGTSPDRTFIIDFAENRVADASPVYGQVQIHELSNQMNVQYRGGTMLSLANGQTATIGFQSAGGASATAYPLTFRGKVLDASLPDAGWSVSALRYCGDGIVQFGAPFGEECDLGTANGTDGSCCTPSCTFVSSGTTCRASAGACDLAESCTGTSDTCPLDVFQSSTTVCRASAGVCDPAEFCTGTSAACPADTLSPSTVVCRASAGACDVAESCTGTSATCPPDAVAAGTVCRSAAGPCDVAEQCDGVNVTCPSDALAPATTVCRPSAGACDVAEQCTGTSAACPADSFKPGTVICRAAAGVCDVSENCTGTSSVCPADSFKPATVTCRTAAGVCDVSENCNGTSAACPADQKSTGVCRSSAGACDVAESCDGASDSCPPDLFQPAGTMCRVAADVCDVAEICTGLAPACPPDATAPNGTPCDDGNSCTSPDTCQDNVCNGTPVANGCADHYLCYKAGASPFAVIPNVHLVDEFEDVTATIVKPRLLCTPASKNAEPVIDGTTHLKAYAFRQTPPHVSHTITMVNQLGTLSLRTTKPDTLLVPTNEDLVTNPPPPDLNATNVNDYKCYKVKTVDGAPPKGTQVTVGDQFNVPPKVFDVRKPMHVCNPVDKNGEGVKNADAHLVCYQVKGAHGQPKHVRRYVFVNNQFGPETMLTIKESELCVPSTKSP